MTVTMVTFRKGGAPDAMVAAARKLKQAVMRHGTENVSLSRVMVGPDAGQWAVRLEFADWHGYGKAMQAASNDPATHEAVAGLDTLSEIVSRRLLASEEL